MILFWQDFIHKDCGGEPLTIFILACNQFGHVPSNYAGTISIAKSGKTCQKWTSQHPHEHERTPDGYPGEGLGNHNYCRNPDNEPEGSWCYTTDPNSRWEYCNCGMF